MVCIHPPNFPPDAGDKGATSGGSAAEHVHRRHVRCCRSCFLLLFYRLHRLLSPPRLVLMLQQLSYRSLNKHLVWQLRKEKFPMPRRLANLSMFHLVDRRHFPVSLCRQLETRDTWDARTSRHPYQQSKFTVSRFVRVPRPRFPTHTRPLRSRCHLCARAGSTASASSRFGRTGSGGIWAMSPDCTVILDGCEMR